MVPSSKAVWLACALQLVGLALGLEARGVGQMVTSPVVVTASYDWDGIDGLWSSFNIRVGTPAQFLRVFASWQGYQTWVIHPWGCNPVNDTTCIDRRGGTFNTNQSSSWEQVGLYSLSSETNLDLGGNAYFGYDVVSLSGEGQEGPTVHNSTVGDLAVNDFYLGILGLNPKPTNWTSFSDGVPSLMTQLKQQGQIPSVSFGYTAGAPYRFNRVPASLTLGGYDASRFETNDITYNMGSDNSRETLVALQSITTTAGNNEASRQVQLLPQPAYMLVDATVAELYLPMAACKAFEDEFKLVYDNSTDLYLVSESHHQELLSRDATISFTIGASTSGGPTTTFDLPYAAFDLTARSPYRGLVNDSRYFPIRRAANATQFTLGRTFMQEAYISVDYERAKFNVSRVVWHQDSPAFLIAIPPTPTLTKSPSDDTVAGENGSGLPIGAIIGIVIGACAVIAAVVAFLLWRRHRRRKLTPLARQNSSRSLKSLGQFSSAETEFDGTGVLYMKAELAGGDPPPWPLKDKGSTVGDLSSPSSTLVSPNGFFGTWAGEMDGVPVYEMPGSVPETNMADSKAITEKDMMRHREKQINGTDPLEAQRLAEQRRRREERTRRPRPRVEAAQVREATEAEGGNKRFSFQPSVVAE